MAAPVGKKEAAIYWACVRGRHDAGAVLPELADLIKRREVGLSLAKVGHLYAALYAKTVSAVY